MMDVKHYCTFNVVLTYESDHYWVKVFDINKMRYCIADPNDEENNGNISGFLYEEIWRHDTKNKREAQTMFDTLSMFIRRLWEKEIIPVMGEWNAEKSQSSTYLRGKNDE